MYRSKGEWGGLLPQWLERISIDTANRLLDITDNIKTRILIERGRCLWELNNRRTQLARLCLGALNREAWVDSVAGLRELRREDGREEIAANGCLDNTWIEREREREIYMYIFIYMILCVRYERYIYIYI